MSEGWGVAINGRNIDQIWADEKSIVQLRLSKNSHLPKLVGQIS
jgi:hypothetical protein